jgi:electron transport complex protein RnfE
MAQPTYIDIAREGLWRNNPALVQILGLCPLLAVTNTVVNAIGLGLATAITMMLSNLTVSLIRDFVRPEIRIPVFVLVIASIVTTIELVMNAYFHELYNVLGIFIPLIVTNCNIIARCEAFASKNAPLPALFDGLMMGLGFMAVLVVLGAMREVLGQGTLLANAHLMFGEAARDLTLSVIDHYRGFLLAILPPGAFIGLGLLIAVKNIIDNQAKRRVEAVKATQPQAQPTAA